jgi:hypothetical protein
MSQLVQSNIFDGEKTNESILFDQRTIIT